MGRLELAWRQVSARSRDGMVLGINGALWPLSKGRNALSEECKPPES